MAAAGRVRIIQFIASSFLPKVSVMMRSRSLQPDRGVSQKPLIASVTARLSIFVDSIDRQIIEHKQIDSDEDGTFYLMVQAQI
jgi:hypothetical protein